MGRKLAVLAYTYLITLPTVALLALFSWYCGRITRLHWRGEDGADALLLRVIARAKARLNRAGVDTERLP